MPRLRVIVLEQDDVRSIRYILWADVPAAFQALYADATLTSAWKGVLAADTTALRAGQMTEHPGPRRDLSGTAIPTAATISFPPETTLAEARALLEARWAEFQAHVTQRNPFRRYGMTWDGTTWVTP